MNALDRTIALFFMLFRQTNAADKIIRFLFSRFAASVVHWYPDGGCIYLSDYSFIAKWLELNDGHLPILVTIIWVYYFCVIFKGFSPIWQRHFNCSDRKFIQPKLWFSVSLKCANLLNEARNLCVFLVDLVSWKRNPSLFRRLAYPPNSKGNRRYSNQIFSRAKKNDERIKHEYNLNIGGHTGERLKRYQQNFRSHIK